MFSYSGHVMTLANSIIGVGILAMPFCFQKCGIILSIVLLVLSNWITRVCCHYLIKTSLLTRRKSFELLGLHAFGASGKLLAELCIIGYLIGTCITYFVVVGDLGPQIVSKMFALDTAKHAHLRTIVMLVVTVLCIAPLGMLRNVDSLSVLCTASIGFYVCLMLKIVLESETHILDNDWTDKVVYWEPAGVLQCLPIFSMALSCQMQLFEVFESINNQSLEKLNGIVTNATWICTLVYIAVGFFGYVAFCTHNFSGNILVNLSPSFGSDIIKIGFVLSIAFSFPLVIFPCRASIYSLLYRKGHVDATNYIPEQRFRAITLFIVGFSLCIALVIPSVELIIGLVGSTIGVAICIMFPASSFRKIIKKESTERTFAQFIFVGGFCLMILGTYANLNAIDEQSSGPQFDVKQVVTPLLPHGKPALELQFGNSELLKHLAKEPEKKPEKQDMPKLELKNMDVKDNNINTEEKLKDSPAALKKSGVPLPPLPVDETHSGSISLPPSVVTNSKIPEKPNNAAAPLVSTKDSINNKSLVEAGAIAVESSVPEKPLVINVPTQQTIDRAAIKKEEEIVAEEQKESKANAEELRKTQNELKKTKELLERTVDELKEELAKQNQEAKNLVAEKLNEVAEKVEEIERKVKKDGPEPEKPLVAKPVVAQQLAQPVAPQDAASPLQPVAPSAAQPDAKLAAQPAAQPVAQPVVLPAVEPKPKASLIELLTENVHAREEQEAHAGVYEPLSYKTGELLKNASIDVPAMAQRLPLPLALLRNASQPNGTMTDVAKESAAEAMPADKTNKTSDVENVEAIRRELLHMRRAETTTPHPSARIKRDTNENCLREPNLNVMNSAAAISLQIENIGRDLKSVNDDDETSAKQEV
ncbi:putative sodium-coupled neutral amino acid transporter 10 isoform X2 [Scaptodrosophila lebanonensis]|uniref:Sodium-coupled neutral amino acid transporter 10 isoform X2 n=1 Tax=Drosophila lebanonensis TaxID=7225 RepID=A0A6J2UKT9_DROLE|nr:putative sodium-coupled neutral amino acid transporter 10 isoform X2 [Scaptodrosophila lebanonensis]